MAERDRTHSYGMRCATHGEVKRIPCACSRDHGTTDVECGDWCPEHEPYVPTPEDVAWARQQSRDPARWLGL